jgi:hypothetical protein
MPRGFGPAAISEMLKTSQRQIKIITNANGMPMLAMPKIVSATSESRFPLGLTLRTDMMPLLRAPASISLVALG